MKQRNLYGFTTTENGKEVGYIRIIKTKIGNSYIALQEDHGKYSRYMPLEDLLEYIEQYPAVNMEEAERQYQNLERNVKKIKEFLGDE